MAALLTLHNPAAAAGYYAAGIWQGDTLYSHLARNASERPDAWALRDPYTHICWREAQQRTDRIAAALREAGVRPGERVSVWLPNRIEAVLVLLACSRNGYICNTSLHQNYTVGEIAGLLEAINSRALFAQVGYGADNRDPGMLTGLATASSVRRVFALPARGGSGDALPMGCHRFPFGFEAGQPPPVSDPDKVTYLAFTSGTTGKPKSVMHSDNTLLANARAMVEDWGHGPDTVLCSLSPVSHHIGTVALNQVLVAGAELVLTDPSAGTPSLDWIVQTGATYVMGVPTHAIDILAAMRSRGVDRLGRVAIFYMAGAPIPRETADSLLSLGITPQNIYGMTENGSHNYTLPSDDAQIITGTCGRSCRAYEVRIFDANHGDEEVPNGEVGEIGGRGGMLMLGYFDNQPATEASFNIHGYLMSGDLGRVDAAGNLQVVGRKKDIIIRGGHNIHPARIEDFALRHPGVLRAAAIPIPDPRLGERVCLVVVPRPAAAPSGTEMVRQLLECGLSKYDLPEFFATVSEFPLTASGKILKRTLIDWLREGRFAAAPIVR